MALELAIRKLISEELIQQPHFSSWEIHFRLLFHIFPDLLCSSLALTGPLRESLELECLFL